MAALVSPGRANPDAGFWRGRRVLVTGHTGFKGAWLCLWLARLGARVHGLALDPPTEPSLYEIARVADALERDGRGDVRDLGTVAGALASAAPEIVFHLAAQPLVRESYRDPVGTIATNVMGTVHVIEAARAHGGVRAIVVATTDKVYSNREWLHPYRETDRLGGHDPYSAGKAAAEIVCAGLRASFLTGEDAPRLATARAGNVIGGGDFAADRLIPDCLAAFEAGEPVVLRYPDAMRPWQHALEPLCGYLVLAQALCGAEGRGFAQAWNFGPDAADEIPVETVARLVAERHGRGGRVVRASAAPDLPEAGLLRLDSTLAKTRLGWRPRWRIAEAVTRSTAWRQAWRAGADMAADAHDEIAAYEAAGHETAAERPS